MATHPTLVVVPGSFTTSSNYDSIANPLRQKGYTIHVLDPPCYPRNYKKGTAAPNMYDDAKFVNDFVTKIVEEGKDVVMWAHSYGGAPTTESLKGITKREREQEGKKGGVVRVAYLTSIVPKIGQSLAEVISAAGEGEGGSPPMDLDEDGWMSHKDPSLTAKMVFNNLSALDGGMKAATFGKHAGPSFASPLTHNGYKDVPVSWFFCEEDLCIVPQVQQTAIDAIEESWKGTEREGKKVDVTRVRCDHAPNYSARSKLEEWVESVIIKGGQE